ncbi:MAG: hypothetical protein QG670_1627 [Thermoproteota archaeon]|nr:hypothetical protein [Thermoproteota archaeon]
MLDGNTEGKKVLEQIKKREVKKDIETNERMIHACEMS